MDLCCDFSKCICCPHISFLKKISPKIFFQSQYCKCSKYTKPFIFLYCIYGLIIIKHLVVLLINSVNGLDAILGGSFSKVREQKIVPLGIRIWRPWLTQLALKRRAINHHCTPAVSSIYEIIKQVSSSIAADEKTLLNGMDRVFNFVVYCWGGYFLWVKRTVSDHLIPHWRYLLGIR